MKTVQVNDRLGSRNISHKNIIAVSGRGLILFVGESIAPVARVIREEYKKDGKWSHTTWTVEVTEDAHIFRFSQDWQTGFWFNATDWAGAIADVRLVMGDVEGITDAMIERFIRSAFPKSSAKLDEDAAAWAAVGDQFSALLEAQAAASQAVQELAAVKAEAIAFVEEAEAKANSAAIKAKLAAAKGGKLSLADLKAALA
jgi:hypothetical protein